MEKYRYCTPEWLEESKRAISQPKFQQQLSKLSTKIYYRVKAEPDWGIDADIIFGAVVDRGEVLELGFYSDQDAKREAEFIMAATPQEWKKILRKENKFLTDFMLGKISLEQGSKVGVLGVAPYANIFVDALTQVDLQFPDEMSPDELEEFRTYVNEFRSELGV
ncbi:MAG: hypothetical protein KAT29_10235 [Anaerolineales bacterium]|nr:hypothetical protein [Anaerolineales bacterium]